MDLDYAPVNIVSLPTGAKIYWNGNYAYLGIYSGNTPQSFNQAVRENRFCASPTRALMITTGSLISLQLTTDIYAITLTPFSGITFGQAQQIMSGDQADCRRPVRISLCWDDDMDGDKDLLVGSKEGTIALFTNTGTDENPGI